MLNELLVVKNVKMIKLVHFKVNEDDFYANTYTDIDRYINSSVNGCPKFDACTKEILRNKQDDDEKESRKNEL